MAVSKVAYNGRTLIDLTQDTAVESDVASGKTFHKADGTAAVGTGSGGTVNLQNKTVNLGSAAPSAVSADAGYDGLGTVSFNTSNIDGTKIKRNSSVCGVPGTFDGVDTSDANATAADIIASKTAYVNGVKLTGTAKSEETVYSELLTEEWGTVSVFTVTKGTLSTSCISSASGNVMYIKKNSAPASDSDYDYYLYADDLQEDFGNIPSSFTASDLYLWADEDSDNTAITSPVSASVSKGYANAYHLTLSGNITLSLTGLCTLEA